MSNYRYLEVMRLVYISKFNVFQGAYRLAQKLKSEEANFRKIFYLQFRKRTFIMEIDDEKLRVSISTYFKIPFDVGKKTKRF